MESNKSAGIRELARHPHCRSPVLLGAVVFSARCLFPAPAATQSYKHRGRTECAKTRQTLVFWAAHPHFDDKQTSG